jgi:3'-phosphoadenosine 5'-phosphosulfate sulfotransferase (PAPS reductase)/FAD synthetase
MVKRFDKGVVGFPLVEWGVTESDALRYCRKRGYDWGGLYDIFPRVSCFCCPLKSLRELRRLRQHFPDLWAKMLAWESQMKTPEARRYKHTATVSDLDARFARETGLLELIKQDALGVT